MTHTIIIRKAIQMSIRKVVQINKSFYIALPPDWVRSNNISKRKKLLVEENDNKLKITS